MEPPIQVTLAANAGVLLRVRNTSILIDALFADTSGCGLSPETRECSHSAQAMSGGLILSP